MLSQLQRLSKGLIIYSALLSDYERLDFKNDALAGVRANYFNSRCNPQEEKSEVLLDERMFTLFYSMREGAPLVWKMTHDKRPYQTVKRLDRSYCVLSYGDNGLIYKKQYFDGDHYWTRSEYYAPDRDGVLCGVVTVKSEQGVTVLDCDAIAPDGTRTRRRLYPSTERPSKRSAGLVYSNCGMVWFDADFAPPELAETKEDESGSGFGFAPESFLSQTDAPLDLGGAPYLTADDYPAAQEQAPAEEEKPYSAYDKIERILYEAHKTNKNLFGELADYTEDEPQPAAEDEPVTEPEPEPVLDEQPAEAPAPVAEPQEEVHIAPAQEPAPDSTISTAGGDYAYYGALDENGGRTGRGRTASPNGVTSYDGEYLDDKRNGFGVSYYRDGSPNYIGGWDMGARSGSGVGYRRSDGTLHAGRWQDNKPEGVGARFDSDGGFIDAATYVAGVKHGKSLSFDENGSVVIGYWENGVLLGERVISDVTEEDSHDGQD